MTDVEVVAFAEDRRVGAWYGLPPGELVGAAWQGASAAAENGRGLMVLSARRRAMDEARRILRRSAALGGRRRPLQLDEQLDRDALARDHTDDAPRRLAALWADTRADRAGWHPRVRVMLYLYAVEGWDLYDLAAAWGVTPAGVSFWLRRVDPGGAINRCGKARVGLTDRMVAAAVRRRTGAKRGRPAKTPCPA